jgi:DNA-binding transcriptional ArsR family regulator
MIEKIFGSRIRAKILGWFFTHPEESFFVRQIATILQEDPTNLSREMSKLENLGILTSKKIGNTKHFQANPHCAFFRELKGLVLKTAGVAGQIKVALERLTGVQFAFIYGSYAKGEEKAHIDFRGNSLVPILPAGNRYLSLNCYRAQLEPLAYLP